MPVTSINGKTKKRKRRSWLPYPKVCLNDVILIRYKAEIRTILTNPDKRKEYEQKLGISLDVFFKEQAKAQHKPKSQLFWENIGMRSPTSLTARKFCARD
jgi:hypothetical protein